MAYTVFARKYRPQTFDELVGQEHVARTLANAITADRVAHAFLFTGVRGVGKTTTARLLAKALNCVQGPTPRPDNTCEICREITAGVDLDVLEMDGASNNSVEDVRRLQESIPYRPTRDRHKVIIVDEVHMLSAAAFNAFLKTLEEPPPHVKFVFATTEAHKVPVTIRSRCQRYDFRLIPNDVVARRVAEILAAEGIETDDAALTIVAREAAGSMRDALTLLDQLVAASGERLRGDGVAEILGIADRDAVTGAMAGIVGGDGAAVLRAVDGVASRGLDLVHFARQLLELSRDLVVLKVAGDAEGLVGLLGEERATMERLVSDADELELQRIFAGLAPVVDEVAQSGAPRIVLEMGLVRLATRPPLRPLGELLGRLEALEKRTGGPPRGGGGGGRGPGSAAGEGRPRGGGRAPTPASAQTSASPPPATRPPATPPARARETAAPKPAAAESPAVGPASSVGSGDGGAGDEDLSAGRPAPPRSEEGEAPVANTRMARWERIVDRVREAHPALGAVLERGVPLVVEPDALEVEFEKGSFFGHQADTAEGRETLAQAAAHILGEAPAVTVRWAGVASAAARGKASAPARRPRGAAPPPSGALPPPDPGREAPLPEPPADAFPAASVEASTRRGPDDGQPGAAVADPDVAAESAPSTPGAPRTVAELTAARRREREEAARARALAHPAVQAAMAVFPEAAERLEVHLELE